VTTTSTDVTDHALGFLLDVDNTLLDNDALKDYLARQLQQALGASGAERFWQLYEVVRKERDVVDLPLTAQRYAEGSGDLAALATITGIYDSIPFARFVYPHAIETLQHLETLGLATILSDGDLVFQRQKIERSGIAAAVNDRVLIYTHKQQHLTEVAAYQPADRSVIVDDKAAILHDVKSLLGEKVTTVHVRQGHYARDPLPTGFQADITVDAIGDLRGLSAQDFLRSGLDDGNASTTSLSSGTDPER